MNKSPAQIAAIEKVHELRAKQRWHSIQEEKKAVEIQFHIRAGSELEDEIMVWELYKARLAKEEALR